MLILNFANPTKGPRNYKPLKLIFGAGFLAAVIGLGSTFAANIQLNSGKAVEFGQGVAQTTSCDDNVILTPYSTFTNSEGAGSFILSSISVSEISSNCVGKEFTIKAFTDSPSSQLDFLEGVSSINILDSGSKFSIASTTGINITSQGITGFTLTFNPANSPVLASSVYRITIESNKDSGAIAVTYSLGETGPGNGVVFYYSAIGFNEVGAACSPSCHYLEWAPSLWNNGGGEPTLVLDAAMHGNSGLSGSVGLGLSNTNALLANASEAATVVRAYRGGDKDDWFIGTSGETDLILASSQFSSGGFMANRYWSSSERGGNYNVWLKNFAGGAWEDWSKDNALYVRPIRAF